MVTRSFSAARIIRESELPLLVIGLVALGASACAAFGTTDTASVAAPEPHMDLGLAVFLELAEPSCGVCHTLKEAGATGNVGPNLDDLKPDAQTVVAAVTDGVGIMPSQRARLTEEEIQAVARYVSEMAGARD